MREDRRASYCSRVQQWDDFVCLRLDQVYVITSGQLVVKCCSVALHNLKSCLLEQVLKLFFFFSQFPPTSQLLTIRLTRFLRANHIISNCSFCIVHSDPIHTSHSHVSRVSRLYVKSRFFFIVISQYSLYTLVGKVGSSGRWCNTTVQV